MIRTTTKNKTLSPPSKNKGSATSTTKPLTPSKTRMDTITKTKPTPSSRTKNDTNKMRSPQIRTPSTPNAIPPATAKPTSQPVTKATIDDQKAYQLSKGRVTGGSNSQKGGTEGKTTKPKLCRYSTHRGQFWTW